MFGILNIAAGGLLSSSSRAALAAQNVVQAAAAAAQPAFAEATILNSGNNAYRRANASALGASGASGASGNSRSALTPLPDTATDHQNAPISLEEELLNLRVAVRSYEANATVFKTVNKTLGSFLEIKL